MKQIKSSAAAGNASHRIASQGNLRILERFLVMLAFLSVFLIGLPVTHAQLPPEYNFRQQYTAVGASYGNPSNSEDAPQLTMSCLAANGYGQWTLSSSEGTGASTNFPIGWYLLTNGLYTPSTHYDGSDVTHYPGCIPPGVVQCGSLSFPSTIKATANLNGMAGYVWPDGSSSGDLFDLSGFTAADINISFSFLSTPTPPLNIASAITSWPSVSTEMPTGTSHEVTTVGDFRDTYDICSDAHFIYIIWASTDHSLVPSESEVWVTVVPIASGTAVAGFPMRIQQGTETDGSIPTITCDPRNNRVGPFSPVFDIE